ncbi:MAG: hypothetical protein ACPGUV_04480, partial [Polyangiales bacterium]
MSIDLQSLIQHLRRHPADEAALQQLRQYYEAHGDFASLANLLEGWALQVHAAASAQALIDAAHIAVDRLQDPHRAIALLRQALHRVPQNARALCGLIDIYASLHDNRTLLALVQAEQSWLLTADVHTRQAVAGSLHQAASQLEVQAGQMPQALTCYELATALLPGWLPALYGARRLHQQSGNVSATVQAFRLELAAETGAQRRLALQQEFAHFLMHRAGDLPGAIALLEQAHQARPELDEIARALSDALLRRAAHSPVPAQQAADRRQAAALLFGLSQSAQGKVRISLAQEALAAWPGHEGALSLIEQALPPLPRHVLAGHWVAFIEHSEDGPALCKRRHALAEAYVQSGQLGDAITCLEPLARQGDVKAQTLLPQWLTALGQHDAAARMLYNQARQVEGEARWSRLASLSHDLHARGQVDQALRLAEEIWQGCPGHPEALTLLRQLYTERQDFPRLGPLLSEAGRQSRLPPALRIDCLRQVALLYEGPLHRPDAGLQAWQALYALDPRDAQAQAALQRIYSAQGHWDALTALLETQVAQERDLGRKVACYTALLQVHEHARPNPEAALRVLQALRRLCPDDGALRDKHGDALLAAGRTREALPILRARLDEASQEADKAHWLRLIAAALEEGGELQAAYECAEALVALDPHAHEALARMERIDHRLGRHGQWLRTLEARLPGLEADEQVVQLQRMAAIASEQLEDDARALHWLEQALTLSADPDAALLDALCQTALQSGALEALLVTLRREAKERSIPAIQQRLHKRVAHLLEHELGHRGAAAEVWRNVLDCGPDEQALRWLLDHAASEGDAATYADFAAQLAALSCDPDEAVVLSLAQARALFDPLADYDAALAVVRTLRQTPGAPAEVWSLGVDIARACGDRATLIETLQAQMQADVPASQQLAAAQELSALLLSPEAAPRARIDALRAWATLAPDDIEPWQALAEIYEGAKAWDAWLPVSDQLAALQTDATERDRIALRAAIVVQEKLGDSAAAWLRFKALATPTRITVWKRLQALATDAAKQAELGALLQQASVAHQDAALLWRASAYFADVLADSRPALDLALAAFAAEAQPPTPVTLDRIDALFAACRDWAGAERFYEGQARHATVEEKVAYLLRCAALLEQDPEQAQGALDLRLRACNLAPCPHAVLDEVQALALGLGRGEEMLWVLERQVAQHNDVAAKQALHLRAIDLALALDDDPQSHVGPRVHQAATAVARDADGRQALEDHIEARSIEVSTDVGRALWESLLHAYRQAAAATWLTATEAATLLQRCAHISIDVLADADAALGDLLQAMHLQPEDETLYQGALDLAEAHGWTARLQRVQQQLIDDSVDVATTRHLLRRQCHLLETVLGDLRAALASYEAWCSLAPDDEAALAGRARLRA